MTEVEARYLLQRWLEWALDWGDFARYQTLVKDTKDLLGEAKGETK